jgi:hypothetical protein
VGYRWWFGKEETILESLGQPEVGKILWGQTDMGLNVSVTIY